MGVAARPSGSATPSFTTWRCHGRRASAAITTSMLVLTGIALAGTVFAWLVIGRRRIPDHIETMHAAAVLQ
jgi:hypothetical protein